MGTVKDECISKTQHVIHGFLLAFLTLRAEGSRKYQMRNSLIILTTFQLVPPATLPEALIPLPGGPALLHSPGEFPRPSAHIPAPRHNPQ